MHRYPKHAVPQPKYGLRALVGQFSRAEGHRIVDMAERVNYDRAIERAELRKQRKKAAA